MIHFKGADDMCFDQSRTCSCCHSRVITCPWAMSI